MGHAARLACIALGCGRRFHSWRCAPLRVLRTQAMRTCDVHPESTTSALTMLLSGVGSFSSSTSLLRSFFLSQTLWPFGSYGFSRFTQILTALKSLAARIISSDSLSVEAKLWVCAPVAKRDSHKM